jgi:lambda family phage portal protein
MTAAPYPRIAARLLTEPWCLEQASYSALLGQFLAASNGPPSAFRLDESAAKTIEYHWWRFCNWRDPVTQQTWFDTSGRKTAAEMDRMNAKTLARDGEYFLRVVPTPANPYGVSFQVLRPDWCDHTYNVTDTGRGTIVHCGVEMETVSRRPVAYYFVTTPKDVYADRATGRPLVRIPAEQIVHGFTQEDEGQPRGIPWAHASLVKLKMLDEFDKAELTAARDEACSVRTYYAPKGDEAAIADLTTNENADVARALTAEKEAGQSEILPLGWKQEIHTPQHPNREITPFKASMLKDVASGFGVEYSCFANDWAGVSFSSVRVGTIAERDLWITRQNDMIAQAKSPQFLIWLRSCLSLSVSGGLPLSKFDKFAEHEFRGRRWMWVDPMKDMNAAKMAVDNGWKTNGQVASDMGADFDDNTETLARENAKKQAAGLTPETTLAMG